jgi:glycosyltransferase involved in cell wall biosynthesis
MNILLLDPFHSGSHAYWSNHLTQQLNDRGNVNVELRTLQGRHWKWRMLGSAAAFASTILEADPLPDAILTTDMMDVAAFRGSLSFKWRSIPVIQYFHENQLTYPWNQTDPDSRNGQNRIYGFMNIQSALAADAVWFNSNHHKQQFLRAVQLFLTELPDHQLPHAHDNIQTKSTVLPIGIVNDQRKDIVPLAHPPISDPPVLLWNHRWEYDKAPDRFFQSLTELKQQNFDFRLILLGQQFDRMPSAWEAIQSTFHSQILHSGWANSQSEYWSLLCQSDLLLHDPRQEYFGISVMEAMRCGVIPLVSAGHAYDDWMAPKFIRRDNTPLRDQMTELITHQIENQKLAIQITDGYDWKDVSILYESQFLTLKR